MTNPLELTMRLRNNLLKARRLAMGLSAPQVADRIGIGYGTYVALEGLRKSPVGSQGWTPTARKIAEFYGCDPQELWPSIVLAVVDPVAVRELSERDAIALLPSQAVDVIHALPAKAPDEELWIAERADLVQEAIATVLDRREQDILMRRIGDDKETLVQIGRDHRIDRERVRQIEIAAIQKVREYVCKREGED